MSVIGERPVVWLREATGCLPVLGEGHELSEQAADMGQFFVPALLDNAPLVHNKDSVGETGVFELVCHHD
ncbi:hypothetical protein GTY53_32245 [Streptomyces sp. SID7805]|uniref:hypothetical protein n=1 Tax=Streptomyces sp. SID7805 TaxID=2690328 RepID=UPI00069A68A8|nr:hypothetical protein [Streptomyces sp. SID7805]